MSCKERQMEWLCRRSRKKIQSPRVLSFCCKLAVRCLRKHAEKAPGPQRKNDPTSLVSFFASVIQSIILLLAMNAIEQIVTAVHVTAKGKDASAGFDVCTKSTPICLQVPAPAGVS